jgi:uncharacterized membrane protein
METMTIAVDAGTLGCLLTDIRRWAGDKRLPNNEHVNLLATLAGA